MLLALNTALELFLLLGQLLLGAVCETLVAGVGRDSLGRRAYTQVTSS